jgi:ubiquinone/menaquinone biosynthesis C-methylase UbiE
MSTTNVASSHEHYEHYNPEMIHRLDVFFGRVDEQMNRRIAKWVVGSRVLDVGCGFGNLSNFLRTLGYETIGIDQMEEFVQAGQQRFPQTDLRFSASEGLDFPDNSFDTVILKDTIHHIYGESDLSQFLLEVKRVCKKRLVVFDPNPTLILRASRKLIGHLDPICAPEEAQKELARAGFTIRHIQFSDVLAFPLSGGYIGFPLVPLKFFWEGIMFTDRLAEKAAAALFLKKHLCWRYLIAADL